MKKVLFAACIVVLFFAFNKTVSAQSVQDFKIENKTGVTINDVYISQANDEKWGEDVMGQDVLENDAEVEINFTGYGEDECLFDVMIGDPDGNYYWLEDVNLCEVHTLTFTADNKKGTPTAIEQK